MKMMGMKGNSKKSDHLLIGLVDAPKTSPQRRNETWNQIPASHRDLLIGGFSGTNITPNIIMLCVEHTGYSLCHRVLATLRFVV